jgi:hypothetical protein
MKHKPSPLCGILYTVPKSKYCHHLQNRHGVLKQDCWLVHDLLLGTVAAFIPGSVVAFSVLPGWNGMTSLIFQHEKTEYRYYSSVELAQELDNQKCKYTFCFLTLCLCSSNFRAKHFTYWLGKHLKTPVVLASEIFPNVPTKRVKCR